IEHANANVLAHQYVVGEPEVPVVRLCASRGATLSVARAGVDGNWLVRRHVHLSLVVAVGPLWATPRASRAGCACDPDSLDTRVFVSASHRGEIVPLARCAHSSSAI